MLLLLWYADEFCEGYPHSLTPTPGYWIECSRQSGPGQSYGIREESQEDSSHEDSCHEGSFQERSEEDQSQNEEQEAVPGSSAGEPFNSTSSSSTDRAGRKVQLVHQHIQVIQSSLITI